MFHSDENFLTPKNFLVSRTPRHPFFPGMFADMIKG